VNNQVAVVLIFIFAILGPSLIIAATGYASIGALGRNPSAAPKIFTAMVLMVVFGSAISIISLLVLFQIYIPKR
jgi:F0F1-type ATP synthase membrane subunit c/vacuolar-type H+-ATPase subunit K